MDLNFSRLLGTGANATSDFAKAVDELDAVIKADYPDFQITDLDDIARRADLSDDLKAILTDQAHVTRFDAAFTANKGFEGLRISGRDDAVLRDDFEFILDQFKTSANLSDDAVAQLSGGFDAFIEQRNTLLDNRIAAGMTREDALADFAAGQKRLVEAREGISATPASAGVDATTDGAPRNGPWGRTAPRDADVLEATATTATWNPAVWRILRDAISESGSWAARQAGDLGGWAGQRTGVTSLTNTFRSVLRNPYRNSDPSIFSPAVKVGDDVVPTNVIPKDFVPVEKRAMYFKYIETRQFRWFRKTTPADAGLEQFGIGRRFIEPIIKHVDAQISGSGVRDAFIKLETDAKAITASLSRGDLSANEAKTQLNKLFEDFAKNEKNVESLKALGDHIEAVKKEVESRRHVVGGPSGTSDEMPKYSPKVGLSWEQKQGLLVYIEDMEKMVAQFGSANNSYAKVFADELDRLESTGRGQRDIARSISKTIDHRLSRFGDDVFMRQTGSMVDRRVNPEKKLAGAAYPDIFRLQNQLDRTVFSPHDRLGSKQSYEGIGIVKAADGNAEKYTYDMMTFYRSVPKADDGVTLDWGKANATARYTGLVTALFEQGADDLIVGAFKALSLRRGVSDVEVFPNDLLVTLRKLKEDAYRTGNIRDGDRWEKIYNVAQKKLDDSARDGPRGVNAENAANWAQWEVMRTAQSGTGRFGLNISQPLMNDLVTGLNNYTWRRPLMWATGNSTSPGVPVANTQQTLGADRFVRTPFFGNGFGKPEAVSQASWDNYGWIRKPLSYAFKSSYSERPMLANAVLNVATDPIRWSWNISRDMALAPFRSRQVRGTLGLWSALAGTAYGVGNYAMTDDTALESAGKGAMLPVTAFYYISKPVVWGADLVGDNLLGAGARFFTGHDLSDLPGVPAGLRSEAGLPIDEVHKALYESAWGRGVFEREFWGMGAADPDEPDDDAPEVTTLAQAQAASATNLERARLGLDNSGYQALTPELEAKRNVQVYSRLDILIANPNLAADKPVYEAIRAQLLEYSDLLSAKFATDLTLMQTSLTDHTMPAIVALHNDINNATDAEVAAEKVAEQQALIIEMEEANRAIVAARLQQVDDILLTQFNAAIENKQAFATAPVPAAINVPLPNGMTVASNENIQPSDDAVRAVAFSSLNPDQITLVSAQAGQAQTLVEAIRFGQMNVEHAEGVVNKGYLATLNDMNTFRSGVVPILIAQIDQKIANGGDAEQYGQIKEQIQAFADDHALQMQESGKSFVREGSQLVAFVDAQKALLKPDTALADANGVLNAQFVAHESLMQMYGVYASSLADQNDRVNEVVSSFQEAINSGAPLASVPQLSALNVAAVDVGSVVTPERVAQVESNLAAGVIPAAGSSGAPQGTAVAANSVIGQYNSDNGAALTQVEAKRDFLLAYITQRSLEVEAALLNSPSSTAPRTIALSDLAEALKPENVTVLKLTNNNISNFNSSANNTLNKLNVKQTEIDSATTDSEPNAFLMEQNRLASSFDNQRDVFLRQVTDIERFINDFDQRITDFNTNFSNDTDITMNAIDPVAAAAAAALAQTAATTTPAAGTTAPASGTTTPAVGTTAPAAAVPTTPTQTVPQWQTDLDKAKADAATELGQARADAGYVSNFISNSTEKPDSIPEVIAESQKIIDQARAYQDELRNGTSERRIEGINSLETMILRIEGNNAALQSLLDGVKPDNDHIQAHLTKAENLETQIRGLSGQNDVARAEALLIELKRVQDEINEHVKEVQEQFVAPADKTYRDTIAVSIGNDTSAGNAWYNHKYGPEGRINDLVEWGLGSKNHPWYSGVGTNNPGEKTSAEVLTAGIAAGFNESVNAWNKAKYGGSKTTLGIMGGIEALGILMVGSWAVDKITDNKGIKLGLMLAVAVFALRRMGGQGDTWVAKRGSDNPFSFANTQGSSANLINASAVNTNAAPSGHSANRDGAPGSHAPMAGGYKFPVRLADGSADNHIFYHADGRITGQEHGGGNLVFGPRAEQQIRDAVESVIVNKMAGRGNNVPANVNGAVDVVLTRPGHRDGDSPLQVVRVDFNEDRADVLKMLQTANAS